jgi:tetratricopeptide (TPR) repeat protein
VSSPDEPDPAGCASCASALAEPGPRYVSVAADPKLAEQLISGSAGTVVCDSCGTSRDVWVPLLYDDPDHDLLIYVASADSEQLIEEYHHYVAMLGPVLPSETYRRATEDQYEIVVGLTQLRAIAQAVMQGVVPFTWVPGLGEAPQFDMSRLLDVAAEYRNAGDIGAAYAVLKRGLTFPISDASYLREFGAYALAAGDITAAEETLRKVSELKHRLRHVPVIRILRQGGIASPVVMPTFMQAVQAGFRRERPELNRSELQTAQLAGQIAGEAEHAMMVLSVTSAELYFIRDITVQGFEMWVSSDTRPDAEDDLRAAFRQARTHYRGPISLDGEADVLLRLGVMLAATEEVAAAEQALQRAKKSESPQIQAEAALHLGFLLYGQDPDAAAENFSLATASPVAQTSAQAFLSLANLALGSGGRQEAQGFLHNAASIGAEPASSGALLELARMANEDGDDATEERFLEQLVNGDYGHVTAMAASRLGTISLQRGAWLLQTKRFDEAITACREAVAIFRETGDRYSEGAALGNLGQALREMRRFDEAITACQDAVAIFRETRDRNQEGMALANLGLALLQTQRFDEAITACQDAISIHRETGDRHGEGVALGNLGQAWLGMRRFDEAIAACQDAVAIFRETGDRYGEGVALGNLGQAWLGMRRFDEAIAACQDAVAIFRDTGDRDSEGWVLTKLVLALRGRGRFIKAFKAAYHAQSLRKDLGG